MPEFTIIGCHCNRAGEASVSLRHTSGAIVSVQHMPFDHNNSETVGQECGRIQRAAADLAKAAVEFLEAPTRDKPIEFVPTLGIAPDHHQPADHFGQPGPE